MDGRRLMRQSRNAGRQFDTEASRKSRAAFLAARRDRLSNGHPCRDSCSGEFVLVEEIPFGDHPQAGLFEGFGGEVDIVDVHRDGGAAVPAVAQVRGVMDIEFRLQQRGADAVEGPIVVRGEFDADEIAFTEEKVREFESFAGPVGVVEDQPDIRAVDRVDDADRKDADVERLDLTHEFAQSADAVFEEDHELPQAGPVVGARGLGIDIGRPAVTASPIILRHGKASLERQGMPAERGIASRAVPQTMTTYLRWRIRLRIFRFLRPILRRPLPVFFTPMPRTLLEALGRVSRHDGKRLPRGRIAKDSSPGTGHQAVHPVVFSGTRPLETRMSR